MKKMMVFCLMLWIIPWSVLASDNSSFVRSIESYEPNQSSVNLQVQVDADEIINAIIDHYDQSGLDKIIKLSVIGSADKTGSFNHNENLASQRAMQMAHYLSNSLEIPLTRINFWSSESSKSVKGVKIVCDFSLEKEVSEEFNLVVYTVLLSVFILFLFLIVYFLRKKKKEKAEFEDLTDMVPTCWPCDYSFLFKMWSEKLYGKELKHCPYCSTLVSGRVYLKHLTKCKIEGNDLFGKTYEEAKKIIEERKDEK